MDIYLKDGKVIWGVASVWFCLDKGELAYALNGEEYHINLDSVSRIVDSIYGRI